MSIAEIIGIIITFIALFITILEKWEILKPRLTKIIKISKPHKNLTTDLRKRRALIVCIATSITSLVLWKSLKNKEKGEEKNVSENHHVNEQILLSIESTMIINSVTGVMHLKGICDDHLPINTSSKASEIKSFHNSHNLRLNKYTLNKIPNSFKEEILKQAIFNSPTSTHLYSLLIKFWGQQKEYQKIHLLLSSSLEFLQQKSRQTTHNKLKRKLNKAVQELKKQQTKADYLRIFSKI